jgi:phosphoserine phosphatase
VVEAPPDATLLVTLSGVDRPGVTSRIFSGLGDVPVAVLDIEQIVIRGRLILGLLLAASEAQALSQAEATLAALASDMNLEVDSVQGSAEQHEASGDRVLVTVLGSPLLPLGVHAVAECIARQGGNIDRIRRIAAYPVTAVCFEVSGSDSHALRRDLAETATDSDVDVAVQVDGLDRRGQHLVVLDVDSTLIQDEVIDLLADEAGVLDAVAVITHHAMAGALDFESALRARVELLKGLPVETLERVRERVRLTPGARTLCRTLQRLGYRVCLVSGGFAEVVGPLGRELGIDAVAANALEVADGKLTGRLVGPVVDRAGKRQALEAFAHEFGIPMRRTIAIGDGANDVDMLEAAGLGVAFNGKAAARAAADANVSVPYLDSVLYLLGVTREEIERADAADGLTTPSPSVSG